MFPATDAGVLAQVVVIAALALAAWYLSRARPELRILIIGLWLAAYGGIGLRALH